MSNFNQYNATRKVRRDGEVVSHAETDAIGNQSVTQGTYATRVAEVGAVTYVGNAPIGTATTEALWQIQKIDSTSGTVVTWADGNDNMDNVWDDYATLTYS